MLVVAPGHLGDGVMALPAIRALAELGPTTVRGPRWAAELYRDLPLVPDDGRRDTAVLLAPSLRAAWSVRRFRRRVGTPSDHRRWLLTDVVDPGLHASDTFRRLAERVGAEVRGAPAFVARSGDPEVGVPEGHVGVSPLSASGAVRHWEGWTELADRLDRPVVFYAGPGEALGGSPGRHPSRIGLPLGAFARALRSCRVFVSVDSGAAHFAAACGVPVVVVHGSTSPAGTGALGAVAVRGPPLPCAPCHRRACPYDHECLRIPVDVVLRAVEERLDG